MKNSITHSMKNLNHSVDEEFDNAFDEEIESVYEEWVDDYGQLQGEEEPILKEVVKLDTPAYKMIILVIMQFTPCYIPPSIAYCLSALP